MQCALFTPSAVEQTTLLTATGQTDSLEAKAKWTPKQSLTGNNLRASKIRAPSSMRKLTSTRLHSCSSSERNSPHATQTCIPLTQCSLPSRKLLNDIQSVGKSLMTSSPEWKMTSTTTGTEVSTNSMSIAIEWHLSLD